MEIVWSGHAREQLQERNLSRSAVLRAVTVPDKLTTQSVVRHRAVKRITKDGKRYLLVVIYDEQSRRREIVTAFLTTKFKKYL